MHLRKLISFIMLATSALPAWSQNLKIPEAINLPFTKVTLDNGLTVVIHEDHKAPIVAVNVWYHVGSKNEPKGKNGFAHLFEHLMFQGSENFNDDYFKGTEKVGATDLNGTTNEDRTNYFQNVPSTALDTALFLESDRMGHFVNAISQAKLDEQRKVVLNEKREHENTPYMGVAEQRINRGTFPEGHPYSWTTIGSDEDLNAASLADVKDWFKTYYGPSNATLTIVGDVQTQDALSRVKKYFGDIEPGPRTSHMKVWIAKRNESKLETVQDFVPVARLFKIYNIPQLGSTDLEALDVASDILTLGKNARLYKSLIYDQRLASGVSASVYPNEIASLFVLDVTARKGVSLEQLDAATNEVMQKFFKDGPTKEELQRVKVQYLSSFVQSMEKIGGFAGKANLLASNEVFFGNPSAYRAKVQERMNFTSNDIRDTAKKWLSSGDYNLHIIPFPRLKASASTVDRKTLPLPTSFPDVKFPEVQEAKLSNGIRVLLARRTHIPTIELQLLFKMGFANDPKDKKGLAYMTFELLSEGTEKRNLFEFDSEFFKLGSMFDAFSGLNYSGAGTKSLKQNLDATLSLFSEAILSPAFSEKELERLKKESLQNIQQDKNDPGGLAGRLFAPLIFGKNHPFGIPFSGTGDEKSIPQLNRKDIVDFYDTWAKPNNAVIIAAGDITLEELKKSLEKQFRMWKEKDVPKFEVPDVKAENNRGVLFLVDRPGSPQTLIQAGHFFPLFNDPAQIPNYLMNRVLGGSFTSRINMNLREEKGWAYGAHSSIFDLEKRRMIVLDSPVQTDKAADAVAEIQKEFKAMATQTKPITSAEFETNRKFAILQLSGGWESNGALFDPIRKIVVNNLDLNFFQTYPTKLQNAKLTEVIASAKNAIHPDNLVWLMIGDKNKILPGLQKLGFKKIVELDEDGNEKK